MNSELYDTTGNDEVEHCMNKGYLPIDPTEKSPGETSKFWEVESNDHLEVTGVKGHLKKTS